MSDYLEIKVGDRIRMRLEYQDEPWYDSGIYTVISKDQIWRVGKSHTFKIDRKIEYLGHYYDDMETLMVEKMTTDMIRKHNLKELLDNG